MGRLFSTILVFAFLILMSCTSLASENAAPVAYFSANLTGGTPPLTVKFTDGSKGGAPTAWLWDFGDNIYSRQAMNAIHTFTKSGMYNVTLRVSNSAGKSSITKLNYINVEASTDTSGKVFDPSGTRWSVAGFEDGMAREYHPVPWEFHSQYYMNAGTIWTGSWSFVPSYPNRINTSITLSDGNTDSCDVVFLSPNWFVAVKDGEPYRLGKRI